MVSEFTCLDDRVSACGGYEATVTTRTRYELVDKIFPCKDDAVPMSYVRLTIVYTCEVYCMRESTDISRNERSMRNERK